MIEENNSCDYVTAKLYEALLIKKFRESKKIKEEKDDKRTKAR